MTTPEKVNLKNSVTSADIINAVTSDAGIQASVGRAANNLASIHEIGNAILSYEPNYNAFVKTLVNRIIAVWVTSKSYRNPWAFFKKGIFELGDTIEEIFVGLTDVRKYDIEESVTDFMKIVEPDVLTAYHVLNYQTFYKKTITFDELKRAFVSLNGVRDLVAKFVESMYTSMNYDEFNMMKYTLALSLLNGKLYTETIENITSRPATDIVTAVKAVSNNLTFMSDKYTFAGNQSFTNKDDQYVIVSAKWDAVFNVEVLASAFNMDKVEFAGHYVMLDSFGAINLERIQAALHDGQYVDISAEQLAQLDNIPAIVVDKDFFMIFDALLKFTENYNGQGLYWNYFLHNWKYFSTSPFVSSVAFVQNAPVVTSVAVTPTAVTIGKGNSQQLSATVVVSNFGSQRVKWSSDSSTITVNETGLVTVRSGANVGDKAAITAASIVDSTKTASCTVTVGA